MNVQHLEKGVRYSDKDLLVLARKIGKLATYCQRVKNEDSWIRVEAERRPTKKSRDQVMVTVTLTLPKKTFRAESRRTKAMEALDRCIEKLTPQVQKYKELHTAKGKLRLFRSETLAA